MTAPTATLTSLPPELIDLIISHATYNVPLAIRLERHLQNYALVHRAFVVACQRRLCRRPRVGSLVQAEGLMQLVQGNRRLAGYVRELSVVGDGMNEGGVMEKLEGVAEVCPMLARLSLREVGFNAALHASLLSRLTHLTLLSVTLSLSSSTSSFPYLTHLTLHNVALQHTSSPPSFPALHSLRYSNTLPSPFTFSASPLFFSSPSLSSLGAQLIELSIDHLFSPTHYLSPSRKSPALATGHPLPLRTPEEADIELEPTLAGFTALEDLTLLADPSHQAGAYFPLLDTLEEGRGRLRRFQVRVHAEGGCRDWVQEVEGVCREVGGRFFAAAAGEEEVREDEQSWRWQGRGRGRASAEVDYYKAEDVEEEGQGRKRRGLETLILPGVFHQLSELEAMKELRKSAQARDVEVRFVL